MSKNPKGPIPPPQPPPSPDPPTQDPSPPFIIHLIRVNLSVLRECTEGEQITVRWRDNPPVVTILSGIHLGEIKAEDAERVRHRKSSVGIIVQINTDTVECAVEIS